MGFFLSKQPIGLVPLTKALILISIQMANQM
jgi:hypothetical protein